MKKNKAEAFSLQEILNDIFSNRFLVIIIFLCSIIFLSWLTYGKAIDYYFWRDDAKVVWMARYTPKDVFSLSSNAVSRGKIGAILIDYLFFSFLGFESYNWQVAGLIIRIINVLLLFFFARELFKSSKFGIIAAILASSFIGGLEAYSWVKGIGVMISLILIAFTLYVASYNKNSKFLFLLSLFATFAVFFTDTLKGLAIVFLISIWEILMLLSKNRKIPIKISLFRLATFNLVQFIGLKIIFYLIQKNKSLTAITSAPKYLRGLFIDGKIENFLKSLGNLLRTPFSFTFEEGGLSNGDATSFYLGALFMVVLVILCVLFIKYRTTKIVPWILIFFWIPFFYLPTWLYERTLTVAATHRYLAFSAVLIPFIWTKLLISIKNNRLFFIGFILIIILNVRYAQKVTTHDYTIRGKDIVLPLWQEMVREVPIGETNSMFALSGDPKLIGYVFQWSDIFPYATLKGIRKKEELPIYVNVPIAAKVVCDPTVEVPDLLASSTKRVGNNFSLNKAYSWEVKEDGFLVSKTNEFRVESAKIAECLWKLQKISAKGELRLTGSQYLDLQSKDGRLLAIQLRWFKDNISNDSYSYQIGLYKKNTDELLGINGELIYFNDSPETVTTSSFNLEKESQNSQFDLSVLVCRHDCASGVELVSTRISL